MTRMLWVTEEVPDADLGGGSIREYHVLRRVAKAIDTDLLLVGHLGDDGLRNSLSQVIELPRPPARPVDGYVRGRVRSVRRTVSGRYPLEIRDAVAVHQLLARHLKDTSKYDVVDIEHEVLAPLLPADRDNRWVITLHNLISQRARQRSALSRTSRSRWLYEADAQRAERFEKWITSKYDV